MCGGGRPSPPPPPPPRPTAPRPEPTARRVVTSTDRTSYRRTPDDPSGRRTGRIGTLRRIGTKSLQIPLLNVSDLNNPL